MCSFVIVIVIAFVIGPPFAAITIKVCTLCKMQCLTSNLQISIVSYHY